MYRTKGAAKLKLKTDYKASVDRSNIYKKIFDYVVANASVGV
jgi:hypothetical protein